MSDEKLKYVYPPDFVDAVIEVFPNNDWLRKSLEHGENIMGFIHGEVQKSSETFSPEQVISFFKTDRALVLLEEARSRVRREERIKDLSNRFWKIYWPQKEKWDKKQRIELAKSKPRKRAGKEVGS